MTHSIKFVKVEGIVEESLPGLAFKVKVRISSTNNDGEEKEKEILAHLAGKLKIHHIRIIPGDRVLIEMPNLEDRRGRIVRRL